MAHFAVIRKVDNVVLAVVRVDNAITYDDKSIEQEARGVAHLQKVFKGSNTPWGPLDTIYFSQTSYNANSLPVKRYNFASKGHIIDKSRNAYIAPKPTKNPILKDISAMTSKELIQNIGQPILKEGKYEINEQKCQWVFIEVVKGDIKLGRPMGPGGMEVPTDSENTELSTIDHKLNQPVMKKHTFWSTLTGSTGNTIAFFGSLIAAIAFGLLSVFYNQVMIFPFIGFTLVFYFAMVRGIQKQTWQLNNNTSG